MLKLLLSIIPRYAVDSDPPAAPAALSGAVKNAGFTCKAVDFNILLYKHLDKKILNEIAVWVSKNVELTTQARKDLDYIEEQWLKIIDEENPEYLGLTLFSDRSVKIALEFIPKVKERFPNIKIILGGAGTSPVTQELYDAVDYYVQGEGEHIIADILKGKDNIPGVNGVPAQQIQNLNTIPFPDYTDFNFDDYTSKGKVIRITGSRGCIRRCNFCTIYKYWPMYRRRSGENLANEIYYQWKTLPTEPDIFIFTDSLINGSNVMLRDLCENLIKLRKKDQEFQPVFKGQWIASTKNWWGDDDWKLLTEAGCEKILIGIESASPDIRLAMNKRFPQSALYYTIEKATEMNIVQEWMLIHGFPGEKIDNFFETVELARKYHWVNNNDYKIILSGGEFSINYGEDNDFYITNREYFDFDERGYWTFDKDKELVYEARIARKTFLQQKGLKWGYDYNAHLGVNSETIDQKSLTFEDLEKAWTSQLGEWYFGNYDLYKTYLNELIEKWPEYLISVHGEVPKVN